MTANLIKSKLNKIAVLVLAVLVLLVVIRSARLTFLRESKKAEVFRVFKKQCAEIGIASWYNSNKADRPTASGERYDPNALTAAHRKFPFGTRLNIINLENGRSVIVRVNDRGPFLSNRIIDLSNEAARQLGMKNPGLVAVCIQNTAEAKK
jgi:rare lipoprotein A